MARNLSSELPSFVIECSVSGSIHTVSPDCTRKLCPPPSSIIPLPDVIW